MNALHVAPADTPVTLAVFVKRRLRLAAGEAEVRILQRTVAVHGNVCLDPDRRLRAGDVVNLLDKPAAKLPEPDELEVVYRDRYLAVVDKPAGVVSAREPRESGLSAKRRERQPTLDELLDRRLRRPHDRQPVVFPVHRLDRDTSGLIAFALNLETQKRLIGVFQAHDVERSYRAVVLNGPPPRRTVETLIARDRGDGRRGSVPPGHVDPTARRAVTHVTPAGILPGGRGVAECRLETGRTHQIRIHLGELGHPVCGDKTYGVRGEPDPPPRQALHAATLGLAHPVTGEPLRFESRLPADLREWLGR